LYAYLPCIVFIACLGEKFVVSDSDQKAINSVIIEMVS